MKYTKFWFPVLLLISIACSEDYLTLSPQATLFASEYFNNVEELEDALIATYDVLGHQQGIGLAFSPPLLLAEIMSDDAFAGGQDAGDGAAENEFNTFNFSTSNEVVRSLWKKGYTGIYRANFTIEKGTPLSTGEDSLKVKTLIAEARFLRAYFYFEMVKFFENIPLLTSVPTSLGEINAPQSNPSDVYNQIAADLVFATNNLPERIGSARASKWAAQSLLARVYLFKNGVYDGDLNAEGVTVNATYCLKQLEDVITNSGHGLLPKYDSIFYSSKEFGIESVFEIAFEPSPVLGDWGSEHYTEGNLAAQMMGPRAGGSSIWYRGWAFGVMTHKLFQDMQGDPRLNATILTQQTILASASSLSQGAYQHTGYYNNKYTTRIEDRGPKGTPELHNTSNIRVIRFSDVLLMAAELGQNANYLNQVRNRVGLANIAYSEDALFRERRMELAGEGLRYFDLLRRGQSVASKELTVSGNIGPQYTGMPISIYNVTFNSATRGFLPIPQVEIDLSAGTLVQNKGY